MFQMHLTNHDYDPRRYAIEISDFADDIRSVHFDDGGNVTIRIRGAGRQFRCLIEHNVQKFGAIYVLLWPIEFLLVHDGLCVLAQWTRGSW